MWLQVACTNNDPRVVAGYFKDCVCRLGGDDFQHLEVLACLSSCPTGCPTIVRADRGTENVHIERLQRYFRRNGTDAFAGEKSFLYGKSTANQVLYSTLFTEQLYCEKDK